MMNKMILVLVGLVPLFLMGVSHADATNFTVSHFWINQTKLYLDINYIGNNTSLFNVDIILHYSTHTKEFKGEVIFYPNATRSLFVTLDPGDLQTAEIYINGNKIATIQINTLVMTDKYGIFVEHYVEKAVFNHTLSFETLFYYPRMTEYGVMWSYDGKTWKNNTYYPKTSMVIFDARLTPDRVGTMYVKFFLKVDDVYMYSTKTYTVKVSPDYMHQNNISGIVGYQYNGIIVWRDYYYNPRTDYTLIATHVLYNGTSNISSSSVRVKLTDWLPPTITVSLTKVMFDPEPRISGRNLTYSLNLHLGKVQTLSYVFKGRADPKLVSELPAPTIISQGHITPLLIKRVYHQGGITIVRVLQYIPEANKTVITTNVTGMNASRAYIIMDTLPGVLSPSSIVAIPSPTNESVSGHSLVVKYNVSNASQFMYLYRFPGHLSPAYIDAIGEPAISTVNIANETNNTNGTGGGTSKHNPLTGLISLLQSGSITYASIILTAAILAFLLFMAESRRPTQVIEMTEEEMILAEME